METITKTNWIIDNTHSEVAFKVKHMMISTVTGHFNEFEAVIDAEDETFKNASISFNATIKSIDTKNADRDNHLKSADFFDADNYPKMAFRSTSFDGKKLIGELSIKDITKEIALDVDLNGIAVDPYGQTKAGFEIRGTINRKDFGLSWSAVTEAGNIVVSDKVKLAIDAQFIQS